MWRGGGSGNPGTSAGVRECGSAGVRECGGTLSRPDRRIPLARGDPDDEWLQAGARAEYRNFLKEGHVRVTRHSGRAPHPLIESVDDLRQRLDAAVARGRAPAGPFGYVQDSIIVN